MKTRFIFIFLMTCLCVNAQQEYINEVNKLNEKGQKEGSWIEDQGSDIIELYYRNGVKNGLFKLYSKAKKLYFLGEYKDNVMFGTWYHFEDDGHLWGILKDFSINTDTVLRFDKEKYVFPINVII